MSKKEEYVKTTEKYLMPILEEMKFEMVDVEYVKEGSDWFLRAYIDKPEGITIEDCVAVSRRMNEILDRENYIEDVYTFEVSSPGLGRALKKERDYVRNQGKKIEIHTFKPINGEKLFFGILMTFDEASVSIQNEDKEMRILKKDIALIRQAVDF